MLVVCLIFLTVKAVQVGSDSSVPRYRLEKLSGLNVLQFAVVCEYVCVWCKYFGFSIYTHFWMCELGYSMKGEACASFVRNLSLRGD